MATRRTIIQRAIRQAFGGHPSDDSHVTELLANTYLNDAIGYAAKANYVDSIKLDGIAYINNGFITTFSDLAITAEDIFTYKITLPQVPIGLGQNEGVSSLRIKQEGFDGSTGKSMEGIPLNVNQVALNRGRRVIPNRFEYWTEGVFIYLTTTGQDLSIGGYTAIVRMASGGDSTDLDSQLNIPDDYMTHIVEYFKAQLGFELSRIPDTSNNGVPDK